MAANRLLLSFSPLDVLWRRKRPNNWEDIKTSNKRTASEKCLTPPNSLLRSEIFGHSYLVKQKKMTWWSSGDFPHFTPNPFFFPSSFMPFVSRLRNKTEARNSNGIFAVTNSCPPPLLLPCVCRTRIFVRTPRGKLNCPLPSSSEWRLLCFSRKGNLQNFVCRLQLPLLLAFRWQKRQEGAAARFVYFLRGGIFGTSDIAKNESHLS